MKLLQSKSFLIMTIILLIVGYAISCTKTDRVLTVGETINNTTDLVSLKVTTAPNIDGTIDAMWENSPKLQFEAVVPDPGGDKFRSYVGNTTKVTLRSVYDATNIYFLAEWSDPTQSISSAPWYFDPTTKSWVQEDVQRTFGNMSKIIREAFSEDKFGMLWNINNSVSGWNGATCYKSCHTGMSAMDGFSAHHTNSATEKVDQWIWRSAKTNPSSQLHDMYQDNAYPDGMQDDDATASDGSSDNLQTLVVTGTTTSITVPKYIIPGKTNYYWILESEITDGTAKLITGVDENGILTYMGGTINPNTDLSFQRNGETIGAKCIPSICTSAFVGSCGDIICKATFTGSGWIVEFKRALKTADKDHDVDFSTLEDQYFGFSVFDNRDLGHAIQPNLRLTFKK
jgi:hypothetical protein